MKTFFKISPLLIATLGLLLSGCGLDGRSGSQRTRANQPTTASEEGSDGVLALTPLESPLATSKNFSLIEVQTLYRTCVALESARHRHQSATRTPEYLYRLARQECDRTQTQQNLYHQVVNGPQGPMLAPKEESTFAFTEWESDEAGLFARYCSQIQTALTASTEEETPDILAGPTLAKLKLSNTQVPIAFEAQQVTLITPSPTLTLPLIEYAVLKATSTLETGRSASARRYMVTQQEKLVINLNPNSPYYGMVVKRSRWQGCGEQSTKTQLTSTEIIP